MKTASILDLPDGLSGILAWVQQGETVILLQEDGHPLGRIVPERMKQPDNSAQRVELFRRRFAPMASVPDRDLSSIVAENQGE